MKDQSFNVGDKFIDPKKKMYHEIIEINQSNIKINSYYNNGSPVLTNWTSTIDIFKGFIDTGDIVKINSFPWEKRTGYVEYEEIVQSENPTKSESKPRHKCRCTHSFFNSSKGCTCGGI